MAYIGKSPDGTGVRSRFYYTQTSGGGTSVSGSSDDGTTLAFSDGAYVDVFLNGVLLVAGTDYNTSTANTIAGLAALANGDVVEVVVYDIFTVADTVSSLNGGTFSGAVGFSGGITGDVAFDTNTLKVDSSNNRVGVGTASPSTKIHLNESGSANAVQRIQAGVNGFAAQLHLIGNNVGGSSFNAIQSFVNADSTPQWEITGPEASAEDQMLLHTGGSERMRIDSSGNVGIGTTSPDSPLHVIGDGKFKGSGETKIRFQNDTTGTGSNDGSFVGVFGGTDGMALYNYEATPMRFFTSNAERMRIAAGTSGGLVRIGQSSDFAGGANSRLAVFVDSSSPAMVTETGDTSGRSHLSFRNGNGEVGGIDTSGSSTSYNTSSDHRLKENVADMTGAIDRVKTLAPKRFNFIADADTTVDGFLAHEAQAVVPEAVTGTHNEVDDDGNAVYQGIDQSKLVPLLTGALQEAIAKIETLETKVAALEAAE